MAEGRVKRLLITMPPRHGKSEFTSKYFPAWYLGRNPDHRVILSSYEADFSMSWGRKVRDLLNEHGQRIFGVSIRRDSTAANRWGIAGRLGGMDTAGVGGPLTGKGAHLFIIDDPVKNSEEAASPTIRSKTWDWFISTAYTRLEPGGSMLLIQTRWNTDDLAGRILENAKSSGIGDEPWEVVNLPALAEEGDPLGRDVGEALWPDRYDTDKLNAIKRHGGAYFFSALYQQRPTPAEGGAFRREWFRYWRPDGDGFARLAVPVGLPQLLRLADCRRFATVDLAFSTKKSADFTVIAAWAVTRRGDLVLLDLHRDRMEGPGIVPAIRAMSSKHGLDYVCIESNGAQLGMVQAARQAGLTVRPLRAEQDKLTRSAVATIRTEAGQVYFPASAPWLSDFEGELLSFPNGAHDDQVDCLSYAALEVQRFGGAPMGEGLTSVLDAAEREVELSTQGDVDDPRWW